MWEVGLGEVSKFLNVSGCLALCELKFMRLVLPGLKPELNTRSIPPFYANVTWCHQNNLFAFILRSKYLSEKDFDKLFVGMVVLIILLSIQCLDGHSL